ncbi:TIGR03936 family radical SAM-associated protein [Clostridium sp.]|uniref:TIGR03936 family radical SAM-associated protein n=1 Tax=Clostridium sp. TaxID=1506 RepID=UPI002583BB0A|nr:TIGR03936 family radical SAM-associated protein [Clostridium sp.]
MKVRYLIKFIKGSNVKFVSHLDIMRTIQRTFKRASLAVDYSKGFNPHMKLSIAQPLSVGMYSLGDYLDIEFKEEVDTSEIERRFNESSNENIKLLKVVEIKEPYDKDGKKIPQAMAAIDGASYTMNIKYLNTDSLNSELDNMLEIKEWNVLKKTKSGEKEVNIKPMVKDLKFIVENNSLNIEAELDCGSRSNLSADLLAKYIKQNTKNVDERAFTEIVRTEMYGMQDKKLIPLWQYFQNYS